MTFAKAHTVFETACHVWHLAVSLQAIRDRAAACRYEMALRMGEIMEELERHDYYAGDGQDLVPSWVRAHFILEQELAQQRAGEDPASIQNAVSQFCGTD